ncbi:hypothetical protein Hdeb2414_s0113g00798811 [Helianthus debilis subsp. tardiflorus]
MFIMFLHFQLLNGLIKIIIIFNISVIGPLFCVFNLFLFSNLELVLCLSLLAEMVHK